MPGQIFFYTGLALLAVHELDAMRCREWRIFPGLSLLSDKTGQLIFILAHVPLFVWIFMQLGSSNQAVFMQRFSVFMIIHLVLHVLFLMHKNNAFKDILSWAIIIGAAVCGSFYLLL
ncbi:MAG: hypothetical protein IM638_17220 [Bacteroidetes bacterium]|nr:hypothetical protein [Bacteroidota bacterium]